MVVINEAKSVLLLAGKVVKLRESCPVEAPASLSISNLCYQLGDPFLNSCLR